jgi:hypothetical protein
MTENEAIEIPLSKSKLAKLLLFCQVFLLIGLWMIITDPQVSNPVFNNPIVKVVASYGSTLMGLLGLYFFTKKLFDNKPGLVLSEAGIYNNTGAFNYGWIPWADVAEISERSVQVSVASKQHFVTVRLLDPDKYISRETNALKRKLLIANSKSNGSPVNISTNGLKTKHEDLLKLMTEYFEKYRQHDNI